MKAFLLTLLFTGDIHFEGRVPSSPFDNVRQEIFNADIAVGNLETTLSNRGTPEDKQFTFRASPEKARLLAEAGFDVIGLANNHTLDYGPLALLDTIKSLRKYDLVSMGAGKDLSEASEIKYVRARGKTVAFLNYSRVLPNHKWFAGYNKIGIAGAYDPTLIYHKVREAKTKADYVVVYIHWGKERKTKPERYQVEMGRKLIDLGADIVVGHHPHVLQPVEIYKGKIIAYSLGNFVFYNKYKKSGILKVSITEKNITQKLIPINIINGKPHK